MSIQLIIVCLVGIIITIIIFVIIKLFLQSVTDVEIPEPCSTCGGEGWIEERTFDDINVTRCPDCNLEDDSDMDDDSI